MHMLEYILGSGGISNDARRSCKVIFTSCRSRHIPKMSHVWRLINNIWSEVWLVQCRWETWDAERGDSKLITSFNLQLTNFQTFADHAARYKIKHAHVFARIIIVYSYGRYS